MHTGFISFCDRINFNIKSSDTKNEILNDLKRFNIQILEKSWYKLDAKGTEHIQKMPHFACLRSNGNPYYMYFTKYDDIPIIYYIDKKIQPGYQVPRMILTKGCWDEEIFTNTLLEGEMVKDIYGGWVFLINDLIAYKNTFLSHEPLPKRLEIVIDMLHRYHVPDDIIDVCSFQVKQYAHATQEGTDALIKLSKTLPYTSRGIYYWPFSNKYKPKLINFDDDLIKSVYRKVKDTPEFRENIVSQEETDDAIPSVASQSQTALPASPASPASPLPPPKKSSTMDILTAFANVTSQLIPQLTPQPKEEDSSPKSVSLNENERILWLRKTENPDVYDIFDSDYAEHKNNKIGIAQVPGMVTSKMLRAVFKDITVAIYVPFICSYNKTADKWLPLRQSK
jgi:hypothetical protein